MSEVEEQVREPLASHEALAKMIDHSLVSPDFTEDNVRDGCDLAARYQVQTVTVRPSDVDIAIRCLRGTGVRVASVAGFPHGSGTTAAKLYELRDLLRRGAAEIDVVLNTGKLLSRQFQYLETELLQMAESCHEEGAVLKVILETAYLAEDHKYIGCRLAKRVGADFVSTSTGYAPSGSTVADVRLMSAKCASRVKVKAAGGIDTLDAALEMYRAGADRIGTAETAAVLNAWRAKLQADTVATHT